jgi:hypothetical protein
MTIVNKLGVTQQSNFQTPWVNDLQKQCAQACKEILLGIEQFLANYEHRSKIPNHDMILSHHYLSKEIA